MSEIAILIPHYNNLSGLYKSVQSINEEIESDIVIVDDGSQEKPDLNYLNTLYKSGRVILLFNEINQKITRTLNKGVAYIRENNYKYLARLDSGDIWYQNKLTKQKQCLDSNPDVALVGCWVDHCLMTGEKVFTYKPHVTYKLIKKHIYGANQFTHPAVLIRVSCFDKVGAYPLEYEAAEDYALFMKIVQHYKAINLPEILMMYEINPSGISISTRKTQLKSVLRIIIDNFNYSPYALMGLIKYSLYYILPYNLMRNIKYKFMNLLVK